MSQSKVKNQLIDPINFTQRRCEFRLDANKAYLPNLRILNVGCVLTGTDETYNPQVGVKGLISRIYLSDGSQELDSNKLFSRYAAYKEYANTNTDNRDKNNFKSGSRLGFTIEPDNGGFVNTTNVNNVLETVYFNNPRDATQNESTTYKGIIELRDELDFLAKVQVLPTNILKNLRLVIEWQTDRKKILSSVQSVTGLTILRPQLMAKEVVDVQTINVLVKAFNNGVMYNTVENDLTSVPVNNADETQTIRYKTNNFRDKYIDSLIIDKEPTVDLSADVSGHYRSLRQINEKVNITLNGEALFDFDGLDGLNKTLSVLDLTHGHHNSLNDNLDIIDNTSSGANISGTVVNEIFGTQDYIGMLVSDRVNTLDLNYSRDTLQNEELVNQQLNLNIYGKVRKQMKVVNGAYVVEYA